MNVSMMNTSAKQFNVTLMLVPFASLVFVIGLVSNILLLTLICKARKVNNNTNVYLFSLGMTGLMRTFSAFILTVTLAAGDWVLGKGICSINQMFMKILAGASTFLFLAMSHDRYRAVKYPFTYWKVKRYITIIINIAIWIVSIMFGLPGSVLAISITARSSNLIWTDCFIGNSQLIRTRSPLAFLDIAYILLVSFCTGFTLIYYVLITKELRSITKYRLRGTLPTETINTRDKPIECSVEKQTAKSLASFILFQSACSVSSILLSSASVVITLRLGRANIISQTIYAVGLFFSVLSAINPFLLMLSNGRFRKRVKDLFKWKLVPEYGYGRAKRRDKNSTARMNLINNTTSI